MDRRDTFLFTLTLAALCHSANVVASPSDVTQASELCRQCLCKEQKINCVAKKITSDFIMDAWAGLGSLNITHVDLSENLISNITHIAKLPIEVLNLSHNRIELIENASFKDLQELQVLDLSHNSLMVLSRRTFEGRYSSFSGKHKPLAALRNLSLAYNRLLWLDHDLFEDVPALTELDLSGNPLKNIDHFTSIAMSSLPELTVLRLRECQLPEIPENFLQNILHLERLDISHNQLKSVPRELEETKNLIFLNLNQNPILRLEADSEQYPGFPRLRKLEELHMSNMPELTSIGAGTLAGLEKLAKLHMSFNPKLSNVNATALARSDNMGETFVWPPIKELYLQSNNLSEVDQGFIRHWDLLERIDLSDNPYLCDCSTEWMVTYLVPMVDQTGGDSSLMVCQEPVNLRGYTMKQIREDSMMRCQNRTVVVHGEVPVSDSGLLTGALIGTSFIASLLLSLTGVGLGYGMYRKCRSRRKNTLAASVLPNVTFLAEA